MIDLATIIAALRDKVAAFGGRVSGAAEFEAAFDASGAAIAPAAWVIPLDDSVENLSQSGTVMALTENFGVYVLIDASADPRGQAAWNSVTAMRLALWGALLGWVPAEGCSAFAYEGGELVRLDRARLFYRFEFSVVSTIDDAGSRQRADLDALPAISSVRLNVDIIEPAADPNLTGGASGPDNRIEHEARWDIPTT